jgi:polysaccharide biosynthesis protein PslG
MRSFALALTLLVSTTASAADKIPPLRIPDAVGVNIHFDNPQPGEFDMLVAAGFKVIRTDILWDQCETRKGVYDFSRWDKLFALYDKHNLRALCPLLYSNPLYDNNLSPHSDEGVQAFANFAVAAVKHFKGRGVMWEIYNEPNNVFWRPQPNVNAYIKLARATAKAIRDAAPDEMIVGPALSGTDGAWLEPIYQAGLLKSLDAVTVHPYGNAPPEERERHYAGVRALIDRYQPKNKSIPIFAGEWGYSSTTFSEADQAKLLARMILFNLSQQIPLTIWYDWRDDGPDPSNAENRFGVVENAYRAKENPPLKPKPAYHAIKTLTTQLDGFTFTRRVKTDSSYDFILLFERGHERRIAAWTTSDQPRTVTFPSFGTTASRTDHLGKVLADVSAEAGTLTVQLNDGPVYFK